MTRYLFASSDHAPEKTSAFSSTVRYCGISLDNFDALLTHLRNGHIDGFPSS